MKKDKKLSQRSLFLCCRNAGFISPLSCPCAQERRLHAKTGFTLVELLVAVVILAITVLMAFHAFVTVTTQRASAYNISAAANLAQDKLEEFKNTPYANIVSGAENNLDETGTAAPDGIFDRAWLVNNNMPISGTKTITVRVTYPYLSGTQTVTLWTIRGQ